MTATDVVYDYAPDTSDSSVIHAAYWNNEDKVLHLVFPNGTVVARQFPTGFQPFHLDHVNSWGSWWNNYVKALPALDRVDNGINFIHRSQVVAPAAPQSDDGSFGSLGQTVTSIPTFEVTDELIEVFTEAYDRYENANYWGGSFKDAVAAGLEAVVASVTAEKPAEEPAAVEENDDDTFIGIGFFNVPEAVRPALSRTVDFFDELVQEQIGAVESAVETHTKKALRAAFKAWLR